MPKRLKSNPRYYKHKASGQAVVTIEGLDFYLGLWKSRASLIEYDQIISEYLANGRRLSPSATPDDITICEIIERFWEHAQAYYRGADGTPTSEIWALKSALDPLNRLYGQSPAHDFGPLSLEAVRNAMIETDWCRRTVNNAVNRVRLLFRWAVSKELIPESILRTLMTVAGLRAGRTMARETAPIQPVSDQVVEETVRYLSPTVRAMVQLQRSTGARPGEICIMATGDIDRSKPVWEYTPKSHKNAYRGQSRRIFIGAKGQEILKPFLSLDPHAFCFSPALAERERRETKHARRKTPLHYGNRPGTNRRRKPKRAPGNRYTVNSYRAAIKRACELAFQPAPPLGKMDGESVRAWKLRLTPEQLDELRTWNATHGWHPHQLRHACATEVRKRFGIETAQAVLGHVSLSTSEIYAARNDDAARQIARSMG